MLFGNKEFPNGNYNLKKSEELCIIEKVCYRTRYKKMWVAFFTDVLYNRQCWSLAAMMREVADTPGRFAMASVGKFPRSNVYLEK